MLHFDELLKELSLELKVLPVMSLIIGQKMVENAKIEKFK